MVVEGRGPTMGLGGKASTVSDASLCSHTHSCTLTLKHTLALRNMPM